MKRYIILTMLILFTPTPGASESFNDMLKEAKQFKQIKTIKKKVHPQLKSGPIAPGIRLTFSDFRTQKNGNKYYWFVTLNNQSKQNIQKKMLEVVAIQYDDQNRESAAGDVCINTLAIPPKRSIKYQREFTAGPDIRSIALIVKMKSTGKQLASKMFEANFGFKLAPGPMVTIKDAIFPSLMSASIKADTTNFLWYAEIKNVGSGDLKFSDYDFNISPAIRGRKYKDEPFTDVTTLYNQTLRPGKTFRIYIATMYDSFYSGDLIHVNIRQLKTGKVINQFRQLDRALYSKALGNGDIPNRPVDHWDYYIDLPKPTVAVPSFVDRVYVSGKLIITKKSISGISMTTELLEYPVTFTNSSFGMQAVTLPDNLQHSNSLTSVKIRNLSVYAMFSGRKIILQTQYGDIIRPLNDMESPGTVNVNTTW